MSNLQMNGADRKYKPFLAGTTICKICGGECDVRSRTKRCRACYLAARRTGKTKVCTGCSKALPRENYYKRTGGQLLPQCKICASASERRKTDPEGFRKWRSEYRKRADVKATRNRKISERIKTDINFYLRQKLNLYVRGALARKGERRAECTLYLLGCDIAQFKQHIEAQWRCGMSWENWGKGFGRWQLDHVRPVSSFDLASPDAQKACFHFSNYQPLWFEENMEKSVSLNWTPSQKIQDIEADRLAFIASRGVTRLPAAKAQGVR